MVRIKGVQVELQTHTTGRWRVCNEFDSRETLEPGANSATRQVTVVECEPSLFRFTITLAANYDWSSKANALRISLTFDEGDPIKEYEVVILRSGGDVSTRDLGLEALIVADDGKLLHYLENIYMPLSDDPSSPWLNAAFEFGRYSRGMY